MTPEILNRCVRLAAGAVFAAAIAVNVVALVVSYHPMPFWDHWETVADYERFLAEGLRWSRLIAQHNEHRIVFSRLLNLADYHLFGGAGLFLILVNVAVSFASALLLLGREESKRLGLTQTGRVLFALAAATSVAQIANLSWAFQTAWFIVLAFALLAIRGYERVASFQPGNAHRAALWLVATLGAATAATFSNANGAVVWIVLVIMGVVLRIALRVQIATAIAAACAIALYLRGYQRPSNHASLVEALRHPIQLLEFMAVYATNSLQLLGMTAQLVLGAAFLVFVAVLLFVERRNRARRPGSVFHVAVLLFLVGTIAITAIGRLALGGAAYANSTRYATYSVFLLVTAALSVASRAAHLGRLREPSMLGCLAVLIATMTWSGFRGFPYAEALALKTTKLQVAACAQWSGCPPETLTRVYAHPLVVRDRLAFLRDRKLAHYSLAPFRPMSGHTAIPHPQELPDCEGFIDGIERATSGKAQLHGWMIWPRSQGELPNAISAASSAGDFVGAGGVCERRLDVQQHLRVPFTGAHRHFGFRTWLVEPPEARFLVGHFGPNGARRCKLAIADGNRG